MSNIIMGVERWLCAMRGLCAGRYLGQLWLEYLKIRDLRKVFLLTAEISQTLLSVVDFQKSALVPDRDSALAEGSVIKKVRGKGRFFEEVNVDFGFSIELQAWILVLLLD